MRSDYSLFQTKRSVIRGRGKKRPRTGTSPSPFYTVATRYENCQSTTTGVIGSVKINEKHIVMRKKRHFKLNARQTYTRVGPKPYKAAPEKSRVLLHHFHSRPAKCTLQAARHTTQYPLQIKNAKLTENLEV